MAQAAVESKMTRPATSTTRITNFFSNGEVSTAPSPVPSTASSTGNESDEGYKSGSFDLELEEQCVDAAEGEVDFMNCPMDMTVAGEIVVGQSFSEQSYPQNHRSTDGYVITTDDGHAVEVKLNSDQELQEPSIDSSGSSLHLMMNGSDAFSNPQNVIFPPCAAFFSPYPVALGLGAAQSVFPFCWTPAYGNVLVPFPASFGIGSAFHWPQSHHYSAPYPVPFPVSPIHHQQPASSRAVLQDIANLPPSHTEADEILGGFSGSKKPRKRGGRPKSATAKGGTGSATGAAAAAKQGSKSKRTTVTTKTEPEQEEPQKQITSFFHVRRSDRKRMTSREVKKVRELETQEKIKAGCEDGLKVVELEGKGRGVIATKEFEKDDFVVEYAGDLVNITTAKQREQLYEKDEQVGCYMYYFMHKNKHYCVDATAESGKLGRLLNHSRKGNCYTKVFTVEDQPFLVLLAAQHINKGEELTYDYGDRSQSALESHPWLKL